MQPLPDDAFPNNPQLTGFKTVNWFYPDGSLLQFDTPPRYVCDEWYDIIGGGIYDNPSLTQMPAGEIQGDPSKNWNFRYRYSGWTNWIDKWSKDMRFSSQSDANATATLFPEVRDPWMFSEYLFTGALTVNDIDPSGQTTPGADFDPFSAGPIPVDPIGIIEPPMINPMIVDRTFGQAAEQGAPQPITQSTLHAINDNATTLVGAQDSIVYDLEWKWKSNATQKTYWESELEAMAWTEDTGNGVINTDFTRLTDQRRVVKYAVPLLNSGVRMNRETVWSRSTRWGQSQNVPPRTVNLTGPKSFFEPDGLFTGRIVPKVKITWGVPLYDPIQDDNGPPRNYAAKYSGYGATAYGWIAVFPKTLSGPDHDPAGIFKYSLVPTGATQTGGLQVQMPRNNTASLIDWNPPNFVDNDLIHHGCQFWKGAAGQAHCDYFTQNPNQFKDFWDDQQIFSDANTAFTGFAVPPYFVTDYTAHVYFKSTNQNTENEVTNLNATVFLVKNSVGAVTKVRVLVDGDDLIPGADVSNGGLISNPGANSTLRLAVKAAKSPDPVPELCAFYTVPPSGNTDSNYIHSKYNDAGGACPFFTPVGVRVMGSYSAEAANGAEWANMQRGLPPGYVKGPAETQMGQTMMQVASMGSIGLGFPAAFGLIGMMNSYGPDPFTAGLPPEDQSFVEVEFVPESIPLTGKAQYYNTPDGKPRGLDPTSDVLIDASPSFFPLDEHDTTPFGAVDTTFFGYVSQNNYRIMHNVQHCYRSDKCTAIINAPGGNTGWRRGWFGGVDFTQSVLLMPGYPAGNGDDGSGNIKHCFTGNNRCPYNNPDRRAVEFDNNYKVLMDEILYPFRESGVEVFGYYGLEEMFVRPDGVLIHINPADFATTHNGQCMPCAAKPHDNSTGQVIGHWQPIVKDDQGHEWRVYFYYDRPSWDDRHTSSTVLAHIVQFRDDDTPAFMVPPWDSNDPQYLAWIKFFGAATNIPWLVMLQEGYRSPNGNMISATNPLPLAGGRPTRIQGSIQDQESDHVLQRRICRQQFCHWSYEQQPIRRSELEQGSCCRRDKARLLD